MYLIQSIAMPELKQYVAVSRSCLHTNNEFELEGKFGMVSFDFSMLPNATSVSVTARRKSGNGHLTVISGENSFDKTILSKTGQSFNVALDDTKKFEIARPNTSIGLLEILSIGLYTSEFQGEESLTPSEWKAILNKCKSHRCLKISDKRLFASEGAFIETEYEPIVSTKPPNMFKYINGFLKFLGTCEITELQVLGTHHHKNEVVYPHIGTAPAAVALQSSIPAVKAEVATLPINSTLSPQTAEILNNILYDAGASILYRLPNLKSITYNGKCILMDHNGSLSIPVSGIRPNYSYTAIVEMSTVNGNGKMRAWIGPGSYADAPVIFVSQAHQSIKFNVTSPGAVEGGVFKLVVERGDSGTGAVAISRITLINNNIINNANLQRVLYQKHAPQFSALPNKPNIVSSANESILRIEELSRKFARINVDNYSDERKFEVSGTIYPASTSSKMWLKKILPLFPNIMVSKHDLNLSTNKTQSNPSVVMCSIDNVMPHHTVYLDEWPSTTNPSKEAINALKETQVIHTPSMLNIMALKQHLPNTTITRSAKFWPTIKVEPQKLDGFIYFEKHRNLTINLLNSWIPEFGSLYVVGSRISLPAFATYISEYENYKTIFSHILGCRAIIDLSYNQSYNSGVFNLAALNRINLITNNVQNALKDLPSIYYMPSTSKESIYEALVKYMAKQPLNNPDINDSNNLYLNGMVESLVTR